MRFRWDYAGGWGKTETARYWKSFENRCRPYDGPSCRCSSSGARHRTDVLDGARRADRALLSRSACRSRTATYWQVLSSASLRRFRPVELRAVRDRPGRARELQALAHLIDKLPNSRSGRTGRTRRGGHPAALGLGRPSVALRPPPRPVSKATRPDLRPQRRAERAGRRAGMRGGESRVSPPTTGTLCKLIVAEVPGPGRAERMPSGSRRRERRLTALRRT